jgi:hypothetical protein
MVYHAEHGGVRPDAESQRDHDGDGEAWIPPNATKGVAEILLEDVQPSKAPLRARILTRFSRIAKLPVRLNPGHVGVYSLGLLVARQHLLVKYKLLTKLLTEALSPQEIADPIP